MIALATSSLKKGIVPSADDLLRLDRPCPLFPPSARMLVALNRLNESAGEAERWRALAKTRLGPSLAVPPEWIVVADSIESLLMAALASHPRDGPLITTPPTALRAETLGRKTGRVVVSWPRTRRFTVELTAIESRLLPGNAIALVMSPNDPTGTVISVQDAVRLARGCAMVVIDERHIDPQAPSLLPLVREFENLVVVRTIGAWCDWGGPAPAYAVARPSLAHHLEREVAVSHVLEPVFKLLSIFEDPVYHAAVLEHIRRERSRLYRMLRKLNMLRPLPSWAPFIAVSVERGTAWDIARRLAATGILVHQPVDIHLDNYLRIGVRSQEATERLKRTLVEIAREL